MTATSFLAAGIRHPQALATTAAANATDPMNRCRWTALDTAVEVSLDIDRFALADIPCLRSAFDTQGV